MKKNCLILCGALAWALCGTLNALPTNLHLIEGELTSCQWNKTAGHLKIETGDRTIFEWDSFSLDRGDIVEFQQMNDQSCLLNRVVGNFKSEIQGVIKSNGRVYLINRSGILIGDEGCIQTAGFLASTLDLSNEEFKQGAQFHFAGDSEESIINLGRIESCKGDVYLLARTIENKGEILAPENSVKLFGASDIVIKADGVFIRVDAENGAIENRGSIEALAIELESNSPYQFAIKNSGNLTAIGSETNEGRIRLVARNGGVVEQGKVRVQGDQGGVVRFLAKEVDLGDSQVDVSANSSGGQVHIGTDEGEGLNCLKVIFREGSLIRADALEMGNGGQIFLKSEDSIIKGTLSACGKGKESTGGFIETTFVDSVWEPKILLSGEYASGSIKIDPKNIVIQSSGTAPASGNTFSSNPSGTVMISAATLVSALSSGNVILEANTDIQFNTTVVSDASNSLTLSAGRSILFSSGHLALEGGDFSATINDVDADGDYRDAGNAKFSMAKSSRIATHGGAITVQASNFGGAAPRGVILFNQATLDAAGGNVTLSGVGYDGSQREIGISLVNTTVSTEASGTINLTGSGGDGTDNNCGIYLSGAKTKLSSVDGAITCQGIGNGTGETNQGIRFENGASILSNGGITLEGTGGLGTNDNCGIALLGGSSIQFTDGSLDITAIANGSGDNNRGFLLEGASFIQSSTTTPSGNHINIMGNGGNGKINNCGISIIGTDTAITSLTCPVELTGVSGGSSEGSGNQGIQISGEAIIASLGTESSAATLTLTGTGGDGIDYNNGISLSGPSSRIYSECGAMTFVGTAGGSLNSNQGVTMGSSSTIASTGVGPYAATLHITGYGAGSENFNNGVCINGPTTAITTVDGNIVVDGEGSGSGAVNYGVIGASAIKSTGTGSVSISSSPSPDASGFTPEEITGGVEVVTLGDN